MRLRVAQQALAGLASGAGAYGLFGTVHSQTDKRPCCNNKYRIEAGLLITGPASTDPITNGIVLMEDGKISYAGAAAGCPATPEHEVVHAPCVMPGMWDAHVHFIGGSDEGKGDLFREIMHTPAAERSIRNVVHCAKAIDAGFTSVREVGGLGVHVARMVQEGQRVVPASCLTVHEGRVMSEVRVHEGVIRGPTIYYAGDILSTTGGHADDHSASLECLAACDAPIGHLCDGVPECIKAVRLQLRKGASVIKICASGGVMSKLDDPQHQQFSDEEIKAIVDEAARSDVCVAAHCHGKKGIMAALRAGCHTIEHGSYLDEQCVAVMKEQGAILVATRWIVEQLKTMIGDRKKGDAPPPQLTREQLDKLVDIYDRHKLAIQLAVKCGVPIALGTDMFVASCWGTLHYALHSKHLLVAMGTNGKEAEFLVECGMTPAQAVEAATVNGPLTLGKQAPCSGQLKAGYDADVIVLSESPLADIKVLGNAKKVLKVWKGGKLQKPIQDVAGPSGRAYARWDQAYESERQ